VAQNLPAAMQSQPLHVAEIRVTTSAVVPRFQTFTSHSNADSKHHINVNLLFPYLVSPAN
jgi:hypothetical protein